MSDFIAQIRAQLDTSPAESQMQSFLAKYKNEPIKLKVSVDQGSGLSDLTKQIKSIQNQTIRFKVNSSSSGLKSVVNSTKKDFAMLKNLAGEISQKQIKIAGLNESKNGNQISVLSTQLNKLESDFGNLYSTLGKNLNTDQLDHLNNILVKASDKVGELNAKSKDLSNNASKATKAFSFDDAITASNRTLAWLKNNSKAAKEYGDALEKLARQQKMATSSEELKGFTRQVNVLKSEAASKGKIGMSWSADFGRAIKQIGQFAGVYGIIQRFAFEVPRQLVQAVRDVNAAQIELAKVSDSPDFKLKAYWDEAAVSAKKYGATISDVISSTADWSRLGYNLDQAKKLSDATTLLQKVGDNMTQESSAKGLISTLRGFQMEANEVESIVDKINEVANTQPIDTSGLFEGLERSASSMDAANNSLEQTIALITAANSVVQDPTSVGTSFKTRFFRNCLYVQKCA